MELTQTERLILSNQYKLLSILDTESSDHYSKLQNIVENGYSIFYSALDGHITEEMPESESHLVLEIMDFYRVVSDFIRSHPEDSEVKEHIWSDFKGFDGNHECDHLGFATFLVREEEKYEEQSSKKSFNSHMPVLGKYRSMLAKWDEFEKSFDISKAQILAVLNA